MLRYDLADLALWIGGWIFSVDYTRRCLWIV